MLRKHRWLVIAGLVLVQVGIIVCYQGFLRGSSDASACPGCCPASKPQTAEPTPPANPPAPVPVAQVPPPIDLTSPPPSLPDMLPAPSPEPLAVVIPDQVGAATNEPMLPAPLASAPVNSEASVVMPNGTLVPVQATASEPPPPPLPTTSEPTIPTPVTPAAPTQVPIPAPPTAPPPVSVPPEPPAQPLIDGPPTAPFDSVPVAPPARLGTPETTPPPITHATNQEPQPPLPVGPCPWTLKMTIVDGLTVVEARIGKEIQFRVVCKKLDLQTPRGSIHAQGDVKISGSGLDGHCQRLLINWTDDRLMVEGNAYLKCLRDGHDVELNAERMSLRLSESSTIKGVGKDHEPPAEETSEPKDVRESGKSLQAKPPMPIRAE